MTDNTKVAKGSVRSGLENMATVFEVSVHTLIKWSQAENRQVHMELLSFAEEAVKLPYYKSLLKKSIAEVTELLGLGSNPKTLMLGMSTRTWRMWIDEEKSHTQVKAMLIGQHWKLLTELNESADASTVAELIKKVNKKGIEAADLVKLSMVSSQAVAALVRVGFGGK